MEEFGCSVEMEPKTLNEGELNNAREAAVDVIKKEPEEASTIFTEGMRTVISMKEMEKEVEMRDELYNLTEGIKNSETDNFSSNRTCTPLTLKDFQEERKIVEPFTAPF